MAFFTKKKSVAVLRLTGAISVQNRRSLNLYTLQARIDKAFSRKVQAVALLINSPGGSPGQSEAIATYIRLKSAEKNIPVYAFVEDVAASGGYWLACAADSIYALSASIIGSIGVISSGFGFNDLIRKWGVDRRVYTAGTNKSHNDPFLPEKADDVARLKLLLGSMHDLFTAFVKSRRGTFLNAPDDVLFNGDFWLAGQALSYGLIDGIGDYVTVLRGVYGDKVSFLPIGEKKGFFAGLFSLAKPTDTLDTLAHTLSTGALARRFGL